MKKTKKKTTDIKPTLIAFLLDRTGSMDVCKKETITGFNRYVEALEKGDKEGTVRFTLTQFDSQSIDLLDDAVPLNKVTVLSEANFQPRGMTPLHDAIGKTIRATELKAGKCYKVLFVTLTDGQENASTEWNADSIKKLMKEKEANEGWTFAHIGVGADGWAATTRLAQGTLSAANFVHVTPQNVGRAMNSTAQASVAYMADTSSGTVKKFYAGHKEQDDDAT